MLYGVTKAKSFIIPSSGYIETTEKGPTVIKVFPISQNHK